MNDYMKQRQQQIFDGRPLKTKEKKPIAKVSEKRKKKLAEQAASGGDSELDRWFEERRKEMKGKCFLCGGKTEKDNDETYRNSLHHFLDKRLTMFPSVATHPDNYWEVCFWNNSCHTNLHNGTISWELLHDSAEWEMIVEKFLKVYPYIAEEEKPRIPELLQKEIDKRTY